jgi:hypothetical protein
MIKKVAVTGAAPASGIFMFTTEQGVPHTLVTKEYKVTPGSLFPITSITITKDDGSDVVLTSVSAATDAATLSTLLKAEMLKIGYNFSEVVNLWPELPSVNISGQTLTIISELTFKAINSAGSVSFTAKSTRKGKCDFTKTSGTQAAPIININGTNRTVAAYTMGTDSAATVKTRIETGLATEISAGTVLSVAVTSDGILYTIVLTCLAGTTAMLNGVSFTQSNCKPYFA